jgi:arylsulfatase A-like enzyme
VHRKGYLTDLIPNERCIHQAKEQATPFLPLVHYNAPHWPWETRADEASRSASRRSIHFDGGSVPTYLTMIQQMDEGIGRFWRIENAKIERNTLVVFTSDNGGERFSDTWPLVGKKMDLLEGGIRVPYIVRWPAKVKAGGVTAQHAITMDWVRLSGCRGSEAAREYPLDGIALPGTLRNPENFDARALLEDALPQPEGAALRRLEVPVRRGRRLPLQSREGRARARQLCAGAEPEGAFAASARENIRPWTRRNCRSTRTPSYAVPATKADLAFPSS